MSPRPDVSEERKEQILGAALTVFARKGFERARIDDVAEEAGLSKGAVYWYFSSKEEIFWAVIESFFTRTLEGLRATRSAEGSVEERLLALARGAVAEIEALFALVPITLEFYARAARGEERATLFLGGYYRSFREEVTALIGEGIERGEFREQADAEEAAIAIISIYEGMIVLRAVDPDMAGWERRGEGAVRLVFESLKAS